MTADPVFTVKGLSCRAPWGEQAGGLPGAAPASLPSIPGFGHSRFGPLVVAVAGDCLDRAPGGAAGGEATALVLVGGHGDTETLDGASRRLAADRRVGPLLFFQSAPTAALGHLCRVHGFFGPKACVSALGPDLLPRAFSVADTLLGLEGIRDVLLVGAESAPNARVTRLELDAPAVHAKAPASEAAFALLLARPAPGDGGLRLRVDGHGPVEATGDLGWLDGAMRLCQRWTDLLRLGMGTATSSAGTLSWTES